MSTTTKRRTLQNGYTLEDVRAIINACQSQKVVSFSLYGLELKLDHSIIQDRSVAGEARRASLQQRSVDVEAELDLLKIEDPAAYEHYIAHEDN